MIQSFTTFGAESSGLGALGVDGQAFLIQLITFVLAYFVLRRYAFGPILKILRERRETIEKGVSLGEKMQKDQTKLAEEIEQKLTEARKEADATIQDAQQVGRQSIREAEETARSKAESILHQAETRISQDTARARKQLESELVGLIAEATEAILQEKVDSTKDKALISKFLKGRA